MIQDVLTRNDLAASVNFILVMKKSSEVNVCAFDSNSCIIDSTKLVIYCSCCGLSGSMSGLKY